MSNIGLHNEQGYYFKNIPIENISTTLPNSWLRYKMKLYNPFLASFILQLTLLSNLNVL